MHVSHATLVFIEVNAKDKKIAFAKLKKYSLRNFGDERNTGLVISFKITNSVKNTIKYFIQV